MYIVRVIGGLGNQMFQYAFFIALQYRGVNSKLDISSFRDYTLHHGFELKEVFDIDIDKFECSEAELTDLKDKFKLFKLRKNIGRLFYNNPNKFIVASHFVEPNYSIYNNFKFCRGKLYLDGYWQSEKYFIDISEKIIKLFKWNSVSKKNEELAHNMSKQNSVSIHIRRFDKPKSIIELLGWIKMRIIWRVCNKNYYINSISEINKRVDNPFFYIFTDNINWVKSNLKIPENSFLVDWNRDKESNQDMYLMSNCKHNIISMSSFSWWGAWLNSNPNKIVISPNKWALRFVKDYNIIPETWIRV